MTSQTLRDARRYEEAMAQNITDQERPEFPIIKINSICIISITHMTVSGDLCTGDMW